MMMQVLIAIALIFMASAGVICLFWPKKVQEYQLRQAQLILGKKYQLCEFVMSERCILPIRFLGVLEIFGVAIALFIFIR